MKKLLLKMFNKKTGNVKKYLSDVATMSKLSNEIGGKIKEFENLQYNVLAETGEDVYIPLADFNKLMANPNLQMTDMLSCWKHASEIQPKDYNSIEVYAISEDNHLVLCPDITECEKHKQYKGSTVKIITIKK
jgi:hypothetical protein